MAGDSILAHMKSKLDLARREMRGAVINLDVADYKLLELRADARRLFQEVKELERKAAKKGLLGFLEFSPGIPQKTSVLVIETTVFKGYEPARNRASIDER